MKERHSPIGPALPDLPSGLRLLGKHLFHAGEVTNLVLVYIASWPSPRASHWSALLTARAIENQAYVIGVNRVGNDPQNAYPGLSCVVDPQGNNLTQGGDRQAVLHADIDTGSLLAYRKALPFLDDMRG